MRRAGHSKYTHEDIERAMAKLKAGQSLSAIARDMGMSKAGLSPPLCDRLRQRPLGRQPLAGSLRAGLLEQSLPRQPKARQKDG